MTVAIVDWLGRGGIAQTSETWAIELNESGIRTEVITRPARELSDGVSPVFEAPARRTRVGAHRALVRAAAHRIIDSRPDVVVVQNYVLPPIEGRVLAAAREVGARVVMVVHDDRLHTMQAGTRLGMSGRLRDADVVIAHSSHVAAGVRAFCGRPDVEVIPLPVPVGMLRTSPLPAVLTEPAGEDLWAAQFGVLRRKYKGSETVELLARAGVDGWRFIALGAGAPEGVSGITAVPGYVPSGALVSTVAATDATLAPYRFATQSATVVLAHALGSVPVASAVGGIPEQVEHGVDGLLIPAGVPIDAWSDALAMLRDDELRKELAVAGVARAWRDHADFVDAITKVVA